MVTSRLKAGLSPEYTPVYLDTTDDIRVIKKGKYSACHKEKYVTGTSLATERFHSWGELSAVPSGRALAEAWRLQGCCSMSQWAAHAAINCALGWLILLIGIGRHNGAIITVTFKWCILTGLKKHPHQDMPLVTFLIFKDIWEDTTKCFLCFLHDY